VKARDAVARSGCQLGSLSTELHKKGGPLAKKSAQLYEKLLTYLKDQFRDHGPPQRFLGHRSPHRRR
jgi:hypothetical protein